MKKYTNKILVGGAVFYVIILFGLLLLIKNDVKQSLQLQNEEIINNQTTEE